MQMARMWAFNPCLWLVFEPFLRSVKEYLDQLGITLDDFDESKHNRDEDGKFSNAVCCEPYPAD